MIRQATTADAAGILKIYAPHCQMHATTFETTPPTLEEMQGRIEKYNSTHLWLVDADHDEIHAYAYACPHRDRPAYQWSVEVSIYIADHKRNQGLGTRLYTRLFVELRERGFYNAYAGITLPNQASVRLHEKLGFKPIGVFPRIGYKLGRWHDVGWYHLVLKHHDDEPSQPVFGG